MPRERSIGSRLRGKVTSLLSPRGGGGENFEAVNNSSGVVIAFSGTNPSRKVKQFISSNGGDFIIFSEGLNKLHTITHLVVNGSDLKPRRTKFLAALCVCPENIVVNDWMSESVQRNTFLPTDNFHIMAHNADENESIEKQYGFSMESTFAKAFAKGETILGGKSVYIGPGVIGTNNGPSRDEVAALLKASGAVHHKTVAGVKKMLKEGEVTGLIVITSEKDVPDDVAVAVGKGATEMSFSDFVSAMLKQDFGFSDAPRSSLIDEGHVIDITQKANAEQVVDGRGRDLLIKVLRIHLDTSPTRSLSNETIGDPERALLGPNGIFEVYKNSTTLRTVVRYRDEEGNLKFEALVPEPGDCHKAIQGNAGRNICILWDACNTVFSSGGTTIRGASVPSNAVAHRRFFFWFNCCDDLKLVLYHLFGNDRRLVEEFFSADSKFFASEITLPDHSVIKPMDAMEEDDPPVRAGFFGEGNYEYDPRDQSQMF